jgi:hypothetical protein
VLINVYKLVPSMVPHLTDAYKRTDCAVLAQRERICGPVVSATDCHFRNCEFDPPLLPNSSTNTNSTNSLSDGTLNRGPVLMFYLHLAR